MLVLGTYVPFLGVFPVLLCDISLRPLCAKKVTSMSPCFTRAAICLSPEYGHPRLHGVERLAAGHVGTQQFDVMS